MITMATIHIQIITRITTLTTFHTITTMMTTTLIITTQMTTTTQKITTTLATTITITHTQNLLIISRHITNLSTILMLSNMATKIQLLITGLTMLFPITIRKTY